MTLNPDQVLQIQRQDIFYFDQLPPELRDLIREAPRVPHNIAEQTFRMLQVLPAQAVAMELKCFLYRK